MKKINLILASMTFAILLAGCISNSDDNVNKSLMESLKEIKETTNYEVKEINGLYSIKIADYMSSTTLLNDKASLQYLYQGKEEKYIIVLDENKQESLDALKEAAGYDDKLSIVDNYALVQLQVMVESGGIKEESELKSLKINGMNARLKAIDANVEGVAVPISYWLGYIEGKENMYTIMAWTLEETKDSFEEEANEMIKSLKEL